MRFYLGAHHPGWLNFATFPLFVSHRWLRRYKTLPRAATPWALDSGGFTELSMHGTWQTSPEEYVEAVYRYRDEVGLLEWAAPQDWMCEPHMLERTGMTVVEHQERTVTNYLALKALAPDLPFVPVLQGWTLDDYLDCTELYSDAGIDVSAEPLVGVGSVCRRQAMDEATAIFGELAGADITMHGFGVKLTGTKNFGHLLASSDSMAWSYRARREPPLPGCTHRNCANCYEFATLWRRRHFGDH